MSPEDAAQLTRLVIGRFEAFERQRENDHKAMTERFDEFRDDLKEVVVQTRETNGRVTRHDALLEVVQTDISGLGASVSALKRDHAERVGSLKTWGKLAAPLIAVVSGSIVAVVAHLIG